MTSRKYLLEGNKNYKIQIIVSGEEIKYVRDGEIIFSVTDAKPYKEGYFGFRTVNSHQKISGLNIHKISQPDPGI